MSVRVRSLLAAALAVATTHACTVGAPPGFSSGDSWAFPLVGPLEDGVLLVPVKVNGQGPFLFLIDPDAAMTSIDEVLVQRLALYGRTGPRRELETGTSVPTRAAEVRALELGNLTVSRVVVLVHEHAAFSAAGRELMGVLGRNVIAESLVFAFDRDAGMAYLATRDAFAAPADALRLTYRDARLRRGLIDVEGPGRRLVPAQVNGVKQTLHLDLGGFQSQLRHGRWKDAHLTPLPYRATVVDELGTPRAVDKAGIANRIEVGPASSRGVLMVPYVDDRADPADVDGSLGLNFFAPYALWADWSGRSIYLRPRDARDRSKLQVRLARWQSRVLAACAQPACVTATRVPGASAPPPVGEDGEPTLTPVEIEVVRDASARELIYEVTLEAVDGDGRSLGLPRLVATWPRGATSIRQKVSPMFADARLRVVDVSPFVRACRQPGGCIFELALAR